MLSYYVACIENKGKLRFRTFCEASHEGALWTAKDFGEHEADTLMSVGHYEVPKLEIVEPALVKATSFNGKDHFSARDHLMKGGSLVTDYLGHNYLISSRIYEQAIFLNDSDEIVVLRTPGEIEDDELSYRHVVGECKISRAGSSFERTFHLEEIDYGHAIDHLLNHFFAMVAEADRVNATH